MPKLLGLNLLAVLVASIAFFFVGFLWYGVLFTDAWMAAHGVVAEQSGGESPIWMVGGFVITVVQVIGLGLVLKWKGTASLGDAVIAAVLVWFCFALPLTMYNYLYLTAHDSTLLMIDASHLLVGWAVSAAILSLMKA
jgi:hypothetical protein